MALILQLETASRVCSVALAQNGVVLAFEEVNQANMHASLITVFIEKVLQHAKKSYDELDAIAVSSGPGSYTGLRIGTATAKGLCFSLDKPLLAVATLEAMTKGVCRYSLKPPADCYTLLCPAIEARGMEVYTAIFDRQGKYVRPVTVMMIYAHTFSDIGGQHSLLFFGGVAEKHRKVLQHQDSVFSLPEFTNSARDLSSLALKKFEQQDFEDIAHYEPLYLRDFVAAGGPKSWSCQPVNL